MNAANNGKNADECVVENADHTDVGRDLIKVGKLLERLTSEVDADGKGALDEAALRISELGEECPDDFRLARAKAEDAFAEVKHAFSDTAEAVSLLNKHLQDR